MQLRPTIEFEGRIPDTVGHTGTLALFLRFTWDDAEFSSMVVSKTHNERLRLPRSRTTIAVWCEAGVTIHCNSGTGFSPCRRNGLFQSNQSRPQPGVTQRSVCAWRRHSPRSCADGE